MPTDKVIGSWINPCIQSCCSRCSDYQEGEALTSHSMCICRHTGRSWFGGRSGGECGSWRSARHVHHNQPAPDACGQRAPVQDAEHVWRSAQHQPGRPGNVSPHREREQCAGRDGQELGDVCHQLGCCLDGYCWTRALSGVRDGATLLKSHPSEAAYSAFQNIFMRPIACI